MTEAEFRDEYPVFSDTACYTPANVQRWLTRAEQQIRPCVWDDTTRQWAIGLFVAHNLVLRATEVQQAASGGLPIGGSGKVSSQSVGGVSVSLDGNSSNDPSASVYNSTTYGQQFYQLLQFAGAGGAFVG